MGGLGRMVVSGGGGGSVASSDSTVPIGQPQRFDLCVNTLHSYFRPRRRSVDRRGPATTVIEAFWDDSGDDVPCAPALDIAVTLEGDIAGGFAGGEAAEEKPGEGAECFDGLFEPKFGGVGDSMAHGQPCGVEEVCWVVQPRGSSSVSAISGPDALRFSAAAVVDDDGVHCDAYKVDVGAVGDDDEFVADAAFENGGDDTTAGGPDGTADRRFDKSMGKGIGGVGLRTSTPGLNASPQEVETAAVLILNLFYSDIAAEGMGTTKPLDELASIVRRARALSSSWPSDLDARIVAKYGSSPGLASGLEERILSLREGHRILSRRPPS